MGALKINYYLIGRSLDQSPLYRLGYQSQPVDVEMRSIREHPKKNKNESEQTGFNSFELRLYDARIGGWLSPDPYKQHFSPYMAMSNNPLSFIDPDGGLDGSTPWINFDDLDRNCPTCTPSERADMLISMSSGRRGGLSSAFANDGDYYNTDYNIEHLSQDLWSYQINEGITNGILKFDFIRNDVGYNERYEYGTSGSFPVAGNWTLAMIDQLQDENTQWETGTRWISAGDLGDLGKAFNASNTLVVRPMTDVKVDLVRTGRGGSAPVPGGARIVKAVTNPKKIVVIGENMRDRVIPFARKHGYKFFNARGTNPANYMRNQVQWIRRQIKAPGTKIIDIGPNGPKPMSPYYKKELDILKKLLGN